MPFKYACFISYANATDNELVSLSRELDLPVIPVLLPDIVEIPEELSFLEESSQVRFYALDDDQALDKLEWGITGKRPRRIQPVVTSKRATKSS